MRHIKLIATIISTASLFVNSNAIAFVSFIDTTSANGIHYTGQSWGASWGDFNGDQWPDLWVSNHSFRPYLYLNNQNGSFTEISDDVLPDDIKQIYKGYDTHGATWADFDNDGDQDLIQAADGGVRAHANWLLENDNGLFKNIAAQYGIQSPSTGSRVPTWFDWNNDGLLDLSITVGLRNSASPKSQMFFSNGTGFINVTTSHGFTTSYGTSFTQAIDIDNNGSYEAMVNSESGAAYIYDVSTQPFTNLSNSLNLGDLSFYKDNVYIDLNADGKKDIYAVTGHPASDIILVDSHTVESRLSLNNESKGFDVKTSGAISIAVYPKFKITGSNIYIGANGYHPATSTFTLSPADTANHGVSLPELLPAKHLNIGYFPDSQQWQIRYTSNTASAINLVAETDQLINDIVPFGIDPNEAPAPDLYFQANDSHYALNSLIGISSASYGRNIVANDFDNDMDDDLFIVRSGSVQNLPNVLYENNGDGTYSAVPMAAGATGNLLGRGDTVTTVDYNRDGFLDLFITNGTSKPPYDKDGSYSLYTNQGNNNNWLQVDLEGVYDNRDGIGARVVVSNKTMTQSKVNNNGTHYRAQNHALIHFGMGLHKRTDVTVYWPNQQIQQLRNVPVNQTLFIQQPGQSLRPGKPTYTPGAQDAVYIWKEHWDGNWQININGNGSRRINQIKVLSNGTISSVNGKKLEANDLYITQPNGLTIDAVVSIGEDALEFTAEFGKKIMVSATWNGTNQLKSIFVGKNQQRQPGSGWLVSTADLALIPEFDSKTEVGLFIGQNSLNTGLSFRTAGASRSRLISVDIMTSSVITSLTPISIDSQDSFIENSQAVHLSGWVSEGYDGFDLSLLEPESDIAVLYTQSGANQYINVNPAADIAMPTTFPNAILLPLPEATGMPVYQAQQDQGIYIWLDKNSRKWHLRSSAGTVTSSISGRIITTGTIFSHTLAGIEIDDSVDISNTQQIEFAFSMSPTDEDGFSFKVSKDAEVSLMLDTGGATLIKIGAEQWPVLSLPVRLQ
ncbi:MAG: CRTAC1 family protein [Methylococcales bacterium]